MSGDSFCDQCAGPYEDKWLVEGYGGHWDTCPNRVEPPDAVTHPKHYTSDPSGIECIQVTRHRNFNVGNAIKYLWRAGLKDADATVEDLRKAVWYINDEIERIGGKA